MIFPRRRPMRRRPAMGRPVAGRAGGHPRVAQAEALIKAGQYGKAAQEFEELAGEAVEIGRVGAAGELYQRAARCYLELSDMDDAVRAAEQAITHLLDAGRVDRVRGLLPKMVVEMEERGQHQQAERFRQQVEARLGDAGAPGPGRRRQARAAAGLPASCPSCGAPVKPDQVSWAGPGTAECAFCGGALKPDS